MESRKFLLHVLRPTNSQYDVLLFIKILILNEINGNSELDYTEILLIFLKCFAQTDLYQV